MFRRRLWEEPSRHRRFGRIRRFTSGMLGSRSSHQTSIRGNLSSWNSSSGSSSRSGRSTGSGPIPFRSTGREDSLELQLVNTSQNLRILTCTASVISVTAPLNSGKGFLELVSRFHRARVLRWVQEGGADPMTVTPRHTRIRRLTTCVFREEAHAPDACCVVLSGV